MKDKHSAPRWISKLIACIYWLLSRTWFFQKVNAPHPKNTRGNELYAHWHGDELVLLRAYIGKGLAVASSRSKDGELMAGVLETLGYRVARGSSSRGGVGALVSLIGAVKKEKRDAALAVDGPRGPIYRVKPGIIKMAQKTGCPVIPVAAACRWRFVFLKAWNRSFFPLPFSSCVMLYGAPMTVPGQLSDLELESYRLTLEQNLVALKGEAERYFQRNFSIAEYQPVGV